MHGWLRFSLPHWRCSRTARRFDFGLQPQCSKRSACRRVGKAYRCQAFELVFGAPIFFRTDTSLVRQGDPPFNVQLWCVRLRPGTAATPDQPPISSEFKNLMVLPDEFTREILAHPTPNDLEAVKLLDVHPPSSTGTCCSRTGASNHIQVKDKARYYEPEAAVRSQHKRGNASFGCHRHTYRGRLPT